MEQDSNQATEKQATGDNPPQKKSLMFSGGYLLRFLWYSLFLAYP